MSLVLLVLVTGLVFAGLDALMLSRVMKPCSRPISGR